MNDDERMPRPPASPENPATDPPAPARAAASLAGPAAPAEAPLPAEPAEPAAPAPAAEAPRTAGSAPAVEGPSPDIQLADEASPLPGAHRGGFQRLPTAPVTVTVESAPAEPGTDDEPPLVQWAPASEPVMQRGLAGWALTFAVIGLVVSLFVGWGFPFGIVAVVSGIIALRRPLESRSMAIWAISIGAVSILYSAGWLLYAASRANLFG
jgi:hypothetical protein